MDIERTRGLTFLFSFAALPMAGCPGGDDETTTNVSTEGTGNETGNETSNVTNATTVTTVGTSMDTSGTTESTTMATTNPSTDPSTETSHGDTDETSSSTNATTETGSSSDSTGAHDSSSSDTGAYVDPLCQGYVDKVIECYPKYARYADYIGADCMYQQMYLEGYSMECGMAFEEALSCIAMADCADLAGMTACVEEFAAVDMLCGGGGSSSGASDAGDMGGMVEGG